MKEVAEQSESKQSKPEGFPPRIKVFRTNSIGKTVEMEVGIQPPLLEDTGKQYIVKGKPITPIEREIAEIADTGYSLPETRDEAAKQRRAIARNNARRQPK